MDKTEWMITENYWDYKVEKMLFTYDEKEQEEIKLAKKVYEQELWKLEYFTFYQIQLENGMNESQAILYNFIDWYTKTDRDFFYSEMAKHIEEFKVATSHYENSDEIDE
jgi:hypothetical protein